MSAVSSVLVDVGCFVCSLDNEVMVYIIKERVGGMAAAHVVVNKC